MSNLNQLTAFIKPYPSRIILTIILGFSGALFNGISTAMIVPIVLKIVGQEIDLTNAPPLIRGIMSPFDNFPENYRLGLMATSIIFIIFLKNASSYASSLASSSVSRTLTSDMRKAGIKLLLDIDINYYTNLKLGDLMNRLNGEIPRAANSVNNILKLIILVITILVFIFILLSISWQLTIISTILLAGVTLVNQFAISRSKYFGKLLTEMSKTLTNNLIETLSGIRLVKATANEDLTYQNINELIQARETAEFKSQVNANIIAPISEVAGLISLILIVFIGRILFAEQVASLSAVLLTYLLVLLRLLPFVSQLNTLRSSFANNSASVDMVADFLQRHDKPLMPNGNISYTQLQEGVHFNHISFAYPGHDQLVLKDVNLYLPKGTTLALVGSSGAGKSTLADLLPRFYDPVSGYIAIDGIDLRQFNIKTLRKAMGIVSQDTFLFNESVKHNIAYGKPGASDQEIITASKRANAYEFISKLPQGLDTMIGDRGVMLSGGQRQRLAIARALLQNPEILILDEATSALDTVSERLVQEAIDDLSRDRTTLVIAHRLSTVQKAHQIAVFDQGRVVELGTHNELLQKDGYYSRLYQMQFGEQAEVSRNSHQLFVRISYEIRTRLNSIIGCLRLLADGMVDDAQERQELLNESYKSTLRIITNIEIFQESIQLQNSWQSSAFLNKIYKINDHEQNTRQIFEEVQTKLKNMINHLVLLADDLVDNVQQQNELITDSYHLAIYLLDSVETLEKI
ncbi:ATP-binding cassette domain-containing protein [Nodularia sp. UHCC 0506]|uniref:ATP-binding cassette domain-containing protein n=1 Tax=Nodularia sp. UHCC 0506 TaxID=3110243 RepID=UPI002B1EB32C|nr:ATP-binding cassette domain-containing protein [Nodularia sp. UHCC 0506]MEA5513662.1 ATP-binding cassette domain-containing protein [Nodularia sp. UHCC 0506]